MRRAAIPFRPMLLLVVAAGCGEEKVPSPPEPGEATLTVTVKAFASDRGQAVVSLWHAAAGFPTALDSAWRTERVAIVDGEARASFDAIAPGTYAVSCYHDEDGSGDLTSNFFGMPKEAVGASRDAKGSFGPPDFEDAAFEIGSEDRSISFSITAM